MGSQLWTVAKYVLDSKSMSDTLPSRARVSTGVGRLWLRTDEVRGVKESESKKYIDGKAEPRPMRT